MEDSLSHNAYTQKGK